MSSSEGTSPPKRKMSSSPAEAQQQQQQHEKSLSMEECAGMAWKRMERHAEAQGRKLPKTFKMSPLLLLWLHEVAQFFQMYFSLRHATDEVTKARDRAKGCTEKKGTNEDDDGVVARQREETVERLGLAEHDRAEAEVALDRATQELSSVYCDLILHFSNLDSTTSDRLYFGSVMQLTLYVLDLLFPNSVGEARSELHRLFTNVKLSPEEVVGCGTKNDDQPLRPRTPTMTSHDETPASSQGGGGPIKASMMPVETTESLVTKQKKAVVAVEAAKNVEAAKRFLEAAATRFLTRLEAKRVERPVTVRDARDRISPLVARALSGGHGNVVPRILQTKRIDRRRVFRKKKQSDDHQQKTPVTTPMKNRTKKVNIDAFPEYKDVFARRYAPGHQTSRTAVRGGFTSAKVTAARNIVATLDQQLSARLAAHVSDGASVTGGGNPTTATHHSPLTPVPPQPKTSTVLASPLRASRSFALVEPSTSSI